MTTIMHEAIKRWRLPLVCLVWMFSLLGLLVRNDYKTFLTADFLPILALTILALFPMALIALLRPVAPRLGMKEIFQTAVILLPLAHIYYSTKTTLGSGAFTSRYVGAAEIVGEPSRPAQPDAEGETSLLDLFLETDKYAEKHVSVVGMLATDNIQVEQIFGRKLPLVFRFIMNCCAADATPVALVLDCDAAGKMENDAWVEAAGILRIRNIDDQELLVLENATMQSAKAPQDPYLYMKWGVF